MTATSLARKAYAQSTKSTATPRAIEYQILSRINGALSAAEAKKKTDHPGYVLALSTNLELWTRLASDAAHPENKLPESLRAQIFYLFEYMRMQTRKILSGDPTANAVAMIDINQNVLSGLRSSGLSAEAS